MSNESPEGKLNISEQSFIDNPNYSLASNVSNEENESQLDEKNKYSTPSGVYLPDKVLSELELTCGLKVL